MIRYGYIADTKEVRGKIRSTCLMEPGDSGGPVFDLLGRVIGIHSGIQKPLDDNFEVAIDNFRKYWTALKIAKDYPNSNLPPADSVTKDPLQAKIALYEPISFSGLEDKGKGSSFEINSAIRNTSQRVLGTLISVKGLVKDNMIKNNFFFISKSSVVGDDPLVYIKKNDSTKAIVVARDEKSDLVLLKIMNVNGELLKNGVPLNKINTDTINNTQLGKFLLSPQPYTQAVVSVVGSLPFDLKEKRNTGFLGITPDDYTGGVKIKTINANTAASRAGLMVGDIIFSINGSGFDGALAFNAILAQYKPGDDVSFKVKRNDSFLLVPVRLGMRPDLGSHVADYFEGGKSIRRDGFKHVFAHDARLLPSECGGPIFDMAGRFMGINIARASRVSTIAIGAAEVRSFVIESLTLVKMPDIHNSQ
jgi:serine protease Do